MRTQWTTKGNRDAGFSCSCDRGLHRYLRNFGGGFEHPKPPLGTPLVTFMLYAVIRMAQWLSGDQHGKSKKGAVKLVFRKSFHHKSYMTSPGSKSRLCFVIPELWEGLTQQHTRVIGSAGEKKFRECKQDKLRKTEQWGAFVQPLLRWKRNKYDIFWECVCSLRYIAFNAHAPYCHPWPARLYSI